MTAYIVSGGGVPSVVLGVRAGTYPVRIAKLEVACYTYTTTGQASTSVSTSSYSSGTMSGGSAVTPLPLREGGPAASATARSGTAALTFSGTATLLHGEQQVAGSGGVFINMNYSFPFDFILASGSSITLLAGGTFVQAAAIYFEELRLAWSL